jgi:hypothetical protein
MPETLFRRGGWGEAKQRYGLYTEDETALTHRYKHRIYLFDVNMDIVFGQGLVQRNGAK